VRLSCRTLGRACVRRVNRPPAFVSERESR